MSMDKLLCKELSQIPPSKLQARLYKFLANVVCDVFWTSDDPEKTVKDHVIQSKLTNPLQWMLFGGDPIVVAATFEGQTSPSSYCGKVFKNGEPAYFCKDCQTDPTCCLCMECFERSEHRNHKYRLFASGGGGCCDCGDPEAWTSGVYCDLHEPVQGNNQEADPTENLSPDFLERAQQLFLGLISYCVTILITKESSTLPSHLLVENSADKLQAVSGSQYVSFLYNDEIHDVQQVISTLCHVGFTQTEAMTLATTVDRKGRAMLRCGDQAGCEEINHKVNRNMDPPLHVEFYHKVVVAHQECALTLLAFVRELVEKAASFRRIVSQALTDCSISGPNSSALDKFFIHDASLWISARVGWQRLVMSSIFMDSVYKRKLAVILTNNYSTLMKNFVEDSHEHDVSLTDDNLIMEKFSKFTAPNMTVQVFTVQSLNRVLVIEHELLQIILKTLQDILRPCCDSRTGILQFTSDNYKQRIFFVINDLRYVLRSKPDQWTAELRKQVLVAYDELLELLSWLQNADAVRRQRFQHAEREKPWEHCVNFCINIQPIITLFVEWLLSDALVLKSAVVATLKKHVKTAPVEKIKVKSHKIHNKSVDLVVFDVFRDNISIYMPLPRLLAALFTGASRHNLTMDQLLEVPSDNTQTPLMLMEHCCRSLVVAVQVMAGMWKKNGFSVVNQIIYYQYQHTREILYDKDVLMLQSMSSLLDPDVFFYALLYKFRLEKWLTSPDSEYAKRGEAPDDALSFFISEAEEFFFLVLTIYIERFINGVGEGITNRMTLQREVVHRLFVSSYSHSELLKRFKFIEEEKELDGVISEVAVQRRHHGSSAKAVFELKPEYESECTPFYYHYTKPDHSKAEELRRKKLQSSGEGANLLPKLPKFTIPYQGILRMGQSQVLYQLMHGVIKQAATPTSKLWSDKLLHEVLYLCANILVEEDSSHPQSLAKTAADGAEPLLPHLEMLMGSQRTEEHRTLIQFCYHHIHSSQSNGSDDENMDTEDSQHYGKTEPMVQPFNEEAEERRRKAMEKRKQVMAQMSSLQKTFLEKHKDELDEIDYSPEANKPEASIQSVQHECAVGVDSLVNHTPSPLSVTCIVCQEETKDFANQGKTFVQAVCLQRSTMMCKENRMNVPSEKLLDYTNVDLIQALASVPQGVFTSGCGHHMHMDCWRTFLDNKKIEHSREHFFPLPGQSVLWSGGEFLCPLCQCFGNTVLPMLPQVGQLSVLGHSAQPQRNVSMLEWRAMVTKAMILAQRGEVTAAVVIGSSEDQNFLDVLESIFPEYKRPQLSGDKGGEALAHMQDKFSQAVLRHAYGIKEDQSDPRIGLAQWRNCAYTISTLEYVARTQDKFILLADTLSPRQLNCVRSLVRLGSEPSVRPVLSDQVKQIHYLTSTFLLTGPADTSLPCLLEVDCFQMLVNLHFSISTLFLSVSSTQGRLTPLVNDAIILPLMGLTDAHLIKVTAAAHLLQFLLTFSPGQDGSADSSNDQADLSDGIGLQSLWIKYRTIAGLSVQTPPSPNVLSVHVKQHMYSFLQCAALFFNCLSGVNLIHSSATAATYFDDLCKYLSLPADLYLLFEGVTDEMKDSTIPNVITSIAEWWCAHPRIAELLASNKALSILKQPRLLIDLPINYYDLVKQVTNFQCPNHDPNALVKDENRGAMLCLVCGEMLCTNSYCCKKTLPYDGGNVKIGGFCQHALRCGAGIGMALWILESYVVLLDVTNPSHIQGCTFTPPYFDEYGEADPGLRRGTPMHFSKPVYEELKQIWYQHRVSERIRKEVEGNRGLMRIQWDRM